MAAALSLALLAACAAMCVSSVAAGCSVNVNSGDMPDPQPLLLNTGPERNWRSFAAPDGRGDLALETGAELLVACPDSDFRLQALAGQSALRATCLSGTTFSVNGTAYTLNSLACVQLPKAGSVNTKEKCGPTTDTSVWVKIGFTVEEEFYELYTVCFDPKALQPRYTNATLIAGIGGFQAGFARPRWEAADLYGTVDVANQYRTQRDTLANLLGALPDKMAKNYLSAGHLAAKADFGLGVQQSATFFYANSAPQWYAFNSGNWNQLELDVRAFAIDNKYNLQVYTGTYGTLQLPNKAGNLTDVYLYASKTESKIPVPMLFWKIIFEPVTLKAMVFVGVNNPFYTSSQLPAEYKLCTDVCSKVDWLRWKPTNETKGLAYCCDYDDVFRGKVTYAPVLTGAKPFPSPSGAEARSPLKLVTILCSVWLLVRQSYN